VYPASGNVPSFSPLAVTIIDAAATATIRGHVSANMTARLVAHVTVLGTTRTGLAVQSDEFVFPVDVCDGCLVTFSPSDVDPMLPEPNCAGNPALGGSSTNLPVPCVLGQDTPVDCVDCLSVPVCRGVVGADGG
jgi:hypothetical protein